MPVKLVVHACVCISVVFLNYALKAFVYTSN